MPEPLIFIFLLIAVAIGFLVGRRTRRSARSRSGRGSSESPWLRQSYFEGLNYLLNEQPDAAIDTFVAALEVNSETLETHFALGNLLRRRGEVERAIRVHQNLLARPSLNLHQQQQAQIELALDYMKSGLLDRAEALFNELLDSDDLVVRAVCLERLIDIYRDEKEWQRAIDIAERLCQRKLGRNIPYWRELQAHFSCELAEQAIERRDWLSARQWMRKALGYDRESLRAHLNLAHIELSLGQFDQAIRALKKIPATSSLYVSEALPLMIDCYKKLDRLEALYGLLEELYQQEPSELLLQDFGDLIFELRGEQAASTFMARELPRFSTLKPMGDLLNIVTQQVGCQVEYHYFAPILKKALAARSTYECRQCGFAGQQLHWCCPTCKHWGTMSPRFTIADDNLELDATPV
jgi:lipopolysaccharide biosynthesis regulator YciM